MNALSPKLRHDLEKATIKARDVAEEAAQQALERLGVSNPEPFPQMTVAERELRNKLRAKGRQLGDIKFENRKQSIHHLIAECGYEHWHQMLFARFLAENNLLMNSDNVPVTLAECEELASHEGATDGWMLASRYASRMLPQIFRPDDAVHQVQFAPEHLHELEVMLSSLSTDVFTADDSLGWVYQFWQSKKKDEVNKSEKKIGADELSAVTQLFTEDYMVLFLLHNTIGAWWTARLLADGKISKEKWSKCASEDDCRRLVVTGTILWEYLRFVKDNQTGEWQPAAGSFAGWPKRVRELTVLDPCCGSGHFLVAAFIILVCLLVEEEGLSAREASDVVLKNCLHGLEIDQRCTQIAAFALALAAWKLPNAGGYRPLPQINIACSGLCVGADKKEWLILANDDTRLKAGMERLYTLFEQAPSLGSLINPCMGGVGDIVEAGFNELRPILDKTFKAQRDKTVSSVMAASYVVRAAAQAAEAMSNQYHLVVTNVPYLTQKKQGKIIHRFCEQYYPKSKYDLATVFIERCLSFSRLRGTVALVTPQNWLFLGSYRKLRQNLLEEKYWNTGVRIGENGFQSSQASGAFVALVVISNESPGIDSTLTLADVSAGNSPHEKDLFSKSVTIAISSQDEQLRNPDHRISFSRIGGGVLLEEVAFSPRGVVTGDSDLWIRCFWELREIGTRWRFHQGAPTTTHHFTGREHLIDWSSGGRGMLRPGIENPAYGRKGVAICQTRTLTPTLYTGEFYDNNTAVIVPRDDKLIPALWEFCTSSVFQDEVRKIDHNLKVTNATLIKVPFHVEKWASAANKKGKLPEPYSFDPTQWPFAGDITTSTEPFQVSIARLLGYRWPDQKSDKLESHVSGDGIVGIPAIMREKPAAERLRELLAIAFGKEWSPAKEAELLHAQSFGDSNLEDWLRNGFFEQHCKLFHQRPFIWHIWDGLKDGFSVLVNYHKLNYQLLERITYTYLNDWLKRQEDSAAHGESGAETRLIAARDLQKKLKLILEGEPPCDIFIRWKSIEQQPIGWNPDLNDGVRLNIRPFVEADVLRKRPNINWNKDRGKDVESAPWYKVFKGERINEHHLTIKEKTDARERVQK